jgi:hypothetical protein
MLITSAMQLKETIVKFLEIRYDFQITNMHNEGAVRATAFPWSQERDCGYVLDSLK